jgi:hypothetical protein
MRKNLEKEVGCEKTQRSDGMSQSDSGLFSVSMKEGMKRITHK